MLHHRVCIQFLTDASFLYYAISQSHRDSSTHYVIQFSSQLNVKGTADTLGTDTLNLTFYCSG